MSDVIVVGGGAGGVAGAVRASQLGSKVTVIEERDIGGLCMNRGCIPTKSLLHSAALYYGTGRAKKFGITVEGAKLDFEVVAKNKTDLVNYLKMGAEYLLKSNKIELVRGSAVFTGPRSIEVNGKTLEAKNFIIAAGSRWEPRQIPGIELEGVISSDEAINMTSVPKSITIIGGGYMEVEFAMYFTMIGTNVTLIADSSRLLPSEDRELSNRLNAVLKDKGVTVVRRATVNSIVKKGGELSVEYSTKKEESLETASEYVLSMNRVPNVESLNLDKAGVSYDENGISVDEELKTNQPHIYAIGDITGDPMYSHRASGQAIAAAENIHGMEVTVKPNMIPRAFFTKPEIGAIGITESDAKDQGLDFQVGFIPYSVNSRAMIELENEGMIKIVSDKEYGEILGVHILGPYATELIGQAALAMRMEATVDDLTRSIMPHPSLSESFPEAARNALGRTIYMPPK